MHFARHSTYADGGQVPIMVRGEGCRVWDSAGRSYLDGLSGLFVVQVGHGRRELAEVAAKQASELAYFPLWSYAHPAAIDLAERLAAHAPGDLNRVFFTTGGGEAVESAWKLAKQYFKLVGKPTKHKVISRSIAYHGTPQGALAITGVPELRTPYEPLVPGAFKVPNTNSYRAPEGSRARSASRSSGSGRRTGWRRRSSTRARTRSRRCSSSRCRTPAAASPRRRGTSSGCARSATPTTCCSSPTR
jgi:adenosylmethionine-8-amino-7-oxononanoate aminotransferase